MFLLRLLVPFQRQNQFFDCGSLFVKPLESPATHNVNGEKSAPFRVGLRQRGSLHHMSFLGFVLLLQLFLGAELFKDIQY
jgi:hypothetical protein